MKNKTILIWILLPFLLISCKKESSSTIKIEGSLIESLINSSAINTATINGKIVILKTKYCKKIDCEFYFQDYSDKIKIYSREDAFMRQITNYIEIEELDEDEGRLMIIKKAGGEHEEIEIKL